MASRKAAFLDIDSKIIENNLTLQECKPAGIDEYKALLGIEDDSKSPWKLVTPKPGFCVKTVDAKKQKTFINICTLEDIPEPKDVTEDQLLELIEAEGGSDYRVPLSLQEPREHPDKAGNPAVCFDVAINPKFLAKVESSEVFKLFLVRVTCDGLKDKFDVDLDAEEYIELKRTKCMGTLIPHRIRNVTAPYKPPKTLVEDVTHSNKPTTVTKKVEEKSNLKYQLVRTVRDGEEFLYGEVQLPTMVAVNDIAFEVGADRLVLECRRFKISLDVNLPVNINPSSVQSEFSPSTKTLSFASPITAK